MPSIAKMEDTFVILERSNTMTTIYELLSEMTSFVSVPSVYLEKAEYSNINSENSWKFDFLLNDWKDGIYDEDPDVLVNNIVELL